MRLTILNKVFGRKAMAFVVCMATIALFSTSCKDTLDGVYPNESEPSIYELISSRSDLVQFKALIDKADFSGTAQAYGVYTCFAPNNEAVNKYLAGRSIDDLTQEEASYMVRYHFVNDTLSTADFNETRLNAMNMSKQYLVTKTEIDENDEIVVHVNRTSTIVDKDNHANNGYVHVIDEFLSRPQVSVVETVKNMPDEDFSTMKAILTEIENNYKYTTVDESGKYGDLTTTPLSISCFYNSDVDTAYVSFLAQTNAAFEKVGITDVNSLLVRLQENDLQSQYTDSELLQNWLGYHCLNGRIYLKDILESSSLNTSIKSQVITITMVVDSVYLNRFKTENIDEDGVFLLRQGDYVDYACKDGVIQTVANELEIIERSAYRVYWDLGDQPEIRALAGYRKGGTTVYFNDGDLSMMRWTGKNSPTMKYWCGGLPEINGAYDEKSQYVYNDNMTFRICTNVMQHLEITCPVLVSGKYNIWICWRRANPGKFNATFRQDGYEDQIMPSNVDLEEYMPSGTDDQLEAKGWKQYNAKKYISVFCCKKIGTVEVHNTGAHLLIFDATSGSKGDGDYWDMIQFIPLDEDQTWPRIAMDGTLVYKGTPDCQIFPNDGSTCVDDPEEGEE